MKSIALGTALFFAYFLITQASSIAQSAQEADQLSNNKHIIKGLIEQTFNPPRKHSAGFGTTLVYPVDSHVFDGDECLSASAYSGTADCAKTTSWLSPQPVDRPVLNHCQREPWYRFNTPTAA